MIVNPDVYSTVKPKITSRNNWGLGFIFRLPVFTPVTQPVTPLVEARTWIVLR